MDSGGEDDVPHLRDNDSANVNDGGSKKGKKGKKGKKEKKGRGIAKGLGLKTGPQIVIDQWGFNGEPIGTHSSKFVSYLGLLVRSRVNINTMWPDVSDDLKEQIWSEIKCNKQPGVTECGYYVMRYMYDIITNYRESENIGKDWKKQERPYSTIEMNEVRDVWARYFKDFFFS
ncbi:hypothetical protein CASFOL_027311 [Castilleja foliolosa]|uniref:Ubiquitin-like protease family profile domain-containing protein n=1 Tax=Castilleja foliolosa TaxID=1961234 RepID=A0ABD3CEG4_9LAMI